MEGNTGQLTYPVIHVAEGQMEGQEDVAAAVSVVTSFRAAPQAVDSTLTRAVFSHADDLDSNTTESHYYYPATIADTKEMTIVTDVDAADSLLAQPSPTGQLYMMVSPQELLGSTSHSETETPYRAKDEKRRAQHNEVERKRRDKINNWIVQLSKTIPDCTMDVTKNNQSKGVILSKACDYINDLHQNNARLVDGLGMLERLKMENQLLRQEVEEWKSKNQMLKSQLKQHGIGATVSMEPQ